jgi:hypothetical protein
MPEKFMAIMYMYFDESGKRGDHPVVTFSSVCIRHSALEEFDNAWNRLLLQYELPYLHMMKASRIKENCGPKMPRHQKPSERSSALGPFADCINEYFELGLMIGLDSAGFNFLEDSKKEGLGVLNNPLYLAFMRGTLEIVKHLHEDDRLSIICDDDAKTAWGCYSHYRAIRKLRPEVNKKAISISFADDKIFPALQAADMVAFLARLEAKRRLFNDGYYFVDLFNRLMNRHGPEKTVWMSAFTPYKKLKELAKETGIEQEKRV